MTLEHKHSSRVMGATASQQSVLFKTKQARPRWKLRQRLCNITHQPVHHGFKGDVLTDSTATELQHLGPVSVWINPAFLIHSGQDKRMEMPGLFWGRL